MSVTGRIAWLGTWGGGGPAVVSNKAANTVAPDSLEALFSAFDQLLTIENPDVLLRRAVELARDSIGLVRVSIYVLDQCRHVMLGTWGSDSRGAILDEHHVMHAMSSIDREACRPDEEGAPYAVFESCLTIEHRLRGTKVAAREWITCTPIRCGQTVVGMMFTDAGPSHEPFDEAKQAQAAILCSLLGTTLGSLAGTRELGTVSTARLPMHRLVMASVAMLAQDPGIEADQIARQLAVSRPRLTRLFEATLGVSLAEYRNRMRLDRLAFLIAKGRTTLAEAAVAAGFASYAQFQLVSRTFRCIALLKRLSQEKRLMRGPTRRSSPQ